MKRLLSGYLLFAVMGAAIAYVLSTAYLDYRLSFPVDYLYLVKNATLIHEVRPELFQHVLMIFGACILAGVLVGVYFITESLSKYGETHWQTMRELRLGKFFEKQGTGFMLAKTSAPRKSGKFIISRSFPHCMVVAPTGRGKGTGFVIPNLLTYKGSTVTLDVKGENYRKTARRRKELGDKVIVFAPSGFSETSHRYNPLLRIYRMNDPDRQLFEIEKLANLFLQTEGGTNESLLAGGIKIFVAATMLAFERGKPRLGEVYKIVNSGSASPNEAYMAYSTETQNKAVSVLWQSAAKMNDRTLTSYISLLNNSGLGPWSNPHFDRMTAEADFEFDDVRKSPHSIYFVIPDQDIKPMAGLVRLFFSDLIASLQHHEPDPKEEPFPVMIILDEFHKLGKMPIVSDSITTLRSFGGHLAIITQTIPKLDEIYGLNERRSLEGGAGVKVYMTPSEELTIENLSEACGKTTKRTVSKSWQQGFNRRVSLSERTEEKPLLTEDDARRLDKEDIILIVDGDHPIRAKAIRYFDDKTLKPIFEAQSGPMPALDEKTAQIDELRKAVTVLQEQVKAPQVDPEKLDAILKRFQDFERMLTVRPDLSSVEDAAETTAPAKTPGQGRGRVKRRPRDKTSVVVMSAPTVGDIEAAKQSGRPGDPDVI